MPQWWSREAEIRRTEIRNGSGKLEASAWNAKRTKSSLGTTTTNELPKELLQELLLIWSLLVNATETGN